MRDGDTTGVVPVHGFEGWPSAGDDAMPWRGPEP
ncbi:hypothetical protein F4559_003435 [Saccharothrix violaceirubra]|uniref:Uncharacterized protein n=1 Tax=Saccharothrix violaceirubra TaxID=413306 RepID=A0A7W7WWG1_9PSEU|nr:hypothetical protein [Saccharothrix violaceirubra]